jgi:PKD repeat protein
MKIKALGLSLGVLTGLVVGSWGQTSEAPHWRVESRQVQVGSDAVLGFILVNAPRGMQRYEVTLVVRNPAIAKFVGVEARTITGMLFRVTEQSDAKVRLQGLDFNNLVRTDTKNVMLAVLTLRALQPGKTEITVETHIFADDSGARASPTAEAGILEVTAPTPTAPQPPPPSAAPSAVSLGFRGPLELRLGAESIVEVLSGPLPNGLQKYHFVVTLSDSATARFKNVRSLALDERFFQVLRLTETVAEFRAVDLNEQIRPGASSIALVALALEGKAAGKARLSLEVKAATDDQSQPLLFSVQSLELAVGAGPPALEPGARPPQDLDGDGLYEDVNGDGKLTFDDPILLAFHLENPVAQEHKRFFDFNRDGVLNFEDVKALAAKVEAKHF